MPIDIMLFLHEHKELVRAICYFAQPVAMCAMLLIGLWGYCGK